MTSRAKHGDLPTIPTLRLLPGRPRRTRFSGGGAFFGGILFFASLGGEVEKRAERKRRPQNRSIISKIGKKTKKEKKKKKTTRNASHDIETLVLQWTTTRRSMPLQGLRSCPLTLSTTSISIYVHSTHIRWSSPAVYTHIRFIHAFMLDTTTAVMSRPTTTAPTFLMIFINV
jgi:hypothetical protein